MRTVVIFTLLALLPVAASAEGITVGDELAICAKGPGGNARGTPAVARGKDGYLVVWREGWHGKGGSARVRAARVSADGKVLDPEGIEIAPSKEGVQVAPRVAFGGGNFLVVWQDFRNGKDHDVLAARVTPEGKILDPTPIAVAAAPRSQVLPDVASDGANFMVVWQGMKGEATGYTGFAAPVGADGKVGTAVETGVTPMPRIAWNGEKYLAICGISETNGVILGTDGKPAGTPVTAIGRSKGASYSVSAVPGRGWLVIGHRSPPDPWGWGGPGAMRCGLVKTDGTMDNNAVKEPSGNWNKLENWLDVGGRKRTTWPFGQNASAWDGTHSVAVWQRHHITGEKKSSFTNCEVMAARVDGWKPVDAEGIPVAATAEQETRPVIASDGAGKLLCVYERHEKSGNVVIAGRTLSTK